MENNGLKLLLETVNTLKNSQGFYSRLASQLEELDDETLQQVGHEFDDCKDQLDVVFKLEC